LARLDLLSRLPVVAADVDVVADAHGRPGHAHHGPRARVRGGAAAIAAAAVVLRGTGQGDSDQRQRDEGAQHAFHSQRTVSGGSRRASITPLHSLTEAGTRDLAARILTSMTFVRELRACL